MISFLEECTAVLTRTPGTLDALLRGLPPVWTDASEGPGTWSPYIVMGHLIHCEKTDWMPRVSILLEHGMGRAFDPVDREAQFGAGDRKPVEELLVEFGAWRRDSLERLHALDLRDEQLELQGLHPALGPVTLRQLLATWTAHDLAHLVQINRVMAKRYAREVGPWAAYLPVMKRQ